MAKAIVQRHYQRIINNWPVDLLRPDVSLQKALQYRIDTKLKPSRSLLQNNVIANEAQATVPTPVPFDEKSELEQVNVLYSFLENRYTKKYPLSQKMRRPASNPDYYDNLMKELNEAPRRTWWQGLTNRWKGFIRWQ
ncbi:hypothetical protein MMC21_001976 [Puttea exsequens]|nr:hypothetical protein [Puttea exsequens]